MRQVFESGKTDELSEHAKSLLRGVLPLLEFADEVLQLDIEVFNRNLREQMAADS